MHIIIRQLGGNNGFLGWTSLMSSRIINSAALKSAITPSFNGLTVRMLSWVFSCIINAFFPTASTFFGLLRSNATLLVLFTITSSLCMISVFAVPRSIAISCVNQLKSPMKYFVSDFLPAKLFQRNSFGVGRLAAKLKEIIRNNKVKTLVITAFRGRGNQLLDNQ